ncbi:MAG: rod-binding protein [SAR324 cluster bacterium]|nr:rod-binding protein [SAR324 cluster bacterium]
MINRFSNISASASSISLRMADRAQKNDASKQLTEAAKQNLANVKKHNAKLRDACDSFEDLFAHKMIKVMREANTQDKDNIMSGGRGEEIFQDMLDEKYATLFSKTNALGMADMIYEHTKMDERTKLAKGLGKM